MTDRLIEIEEHTKVSMKGLYIACLLLAILLIIAGCRTDIATFDDSMDGDAFDGDIEEEALPDCPKINFHRLCACIWGEDEHIARGDGDESFSVLLHAMVADTGLGEPTNGCFLEPNSGHILLYQPEYFDKVHWLQLEDDEGFEWMLGVVDPALAGFPEVGEEVTILFTYAWESDGEYGSLKLSWGDDQFYYFGYNQDWTEVPFRIRRGQPYCRRVEDYSIWERNQIEVSGDTGCYLLAPHTYADIEGYRIYLNSQEQPLGDPGDIPINHEFFSFSTLSNDSPFPEDVPHAQPCPE